MFAGVEKMIWETFLPRLFFVKTKSLSPTVGAPSKTTSKKYGLGLLNPVTSINDKYLGSHQSKTELIRSVMEESMFSNTDHPLMLMEESFDGQKKWDDANDVKLKGLVRDLDTTKGHIILCAKNTGAWLNVQGTTVTGT